MYLLGYDIGSSSIKVALIDAASHKLIALEKSPETEMKIISPQTGWAEQDPNEWWSHVCLATNRLIQNHKIDTKEIKSIGIAYQMHGLVMVDKYLEVIRPSIIWCDSRAVGIGNKALQDIGADYCFQNYLNSPGNFTASKLKWVQENEVENFNKIHKILLPGDFIAMKITGQCSTTVSGLSEGILWNFRSNQIAKKIMEHYAFDESIIPEIYNSLETPGEVSAEAAKSLGLQKGTPVTYRAGDQPNNALSLGVYKNGQVAATGGTSGVVYSLSDQLPSDKKSRVNSFAHVNHNNLSPKIGTLLCINGAGIQYAWLRELLKKNNLSYSELESKIATLPIGSKGLRIIPFGNGSERMLNNKNTGAQINNLQFNVHNDDYLLRAGLEGIAFSFVYGLSILKDLGLQISQLKVGSDNLFLSDIFSQTISNLTETTIDIIKTTGAIGAAKASGISPGIYSSIEEAFKHNDKLKTIQPQNSTSEHQKAYDLWADDLKKIIHT